MEINQSQNEILKENNFNNKNINSLIDWNNWQIDPEYPSYGYGGDDFTYDMDANNIILDSEFFHYIKGDTKSTGFLRGVSFSFATEDKPNDKIPFKELGLNSKNDIKNITVTSKSCYVNKINNFYFKDKWGNKTDDLEQAVALYTPFQDDGDILFTGGIGKSKSVFGLNANEGGTRFKVNVSWNADQNKIDSYNPNYIASTVRGDYVPQVVKTYYKDIESGQEVSSSEIFGKNGVINEDYNFSPKNLEKEGYTLKKAELSVNSDENTKEISKDKVSGKLNEDKNAYTFYYEKNKITTSSVNINYVDEEGNKIYSSETLTGNIGSDYKTEQKKIDGYDFKKVIGNVEGKFTQDIQNVTYVYNKNETSKKPNEDNNSSSYNSGKDNQNNHDASNKEGFLPNTGMGNGLYLFSTVGILILISGILFFKSRKNN